MARRQVETNAIGTMKNSARFDLGFERAHAVAPLQHCAALCPRAPPPQHLPASAHDATLRGESERERERERARARERERAGSVRASGERGGQRAAPCDR